MDVDEKNKIKPEAKTRRRGGRAASWSGVERDKQWRMHRQLEDEISKTGRQKMMAMRARGKKERRQSELSEHTHAMPAKSRRGEKKEKKVGKE